MAMFVRGGVGPSSESAVGRKPQILLTGGLMVQAEFVLASGFIGKMDLPIGTEVHHTGTINASTIGVVHCVRVLESNDTVADWFLVSQLGTAAALTTLVST